MCRSQAQDVMYTSRVAVLDRLFLLFEFFSNLLDENQSTVLTRRNVKVKDTICCHLLGNLYLPDCWLCQARFHSITLYSAITSAVKGLLKLANNWVNKYLLETNKCWTQVQYVCTIVGGNYKSPKSKIAVWGIGVVLSG